MAWDRLSHDFALKPRNPHLDAASVEKSRGAVPTQNQKRRAPFIWGAGARQQQYLTLATANPDTCASCERQEELDAFFGAKTRADIIGLHEVRRPFNNRFGTTPGGGKYTLYHTACEMLSNGSPNLGVGIVVRTHLVSTIMSIRLLSPRLLIAKFRGARRNLTVYVAHAPH